MRLNRASIIEESVSQWQPGDGDLIGYINAALVDAGEAQLNCCERRDVFNDYAAARTVELSNG